MDVNAGRYLDGVPMATLGDEVLDMTLKAASGKRTAGEKAGHAQVQVRRRKEIWEKRWEEKERERQRERVWTWRHEEARKGERIERKKSDKEIEGEMMEKIETEIETVTKTKRERE
jgi:hypothetical protein